MRVFYRFILLLQSFSFIVSFLLSSFRHDLLISHHISNSLVLKHSKSYHNENNEIINKIISLEQEIMRTDSDNRQVIIEKFSSLKTMLMNSQLLSSKSKSKLIIQ